MKFLIEFDLDHDGSLAYRAKWVLVLSIVALFLM